MWLVIVLFDRNALRFGIGNDLLRCALKFSVDGCSDRLKCGGYAMGWGSVEGVVSSRATGDASVEVGLERLTRINAEEYKCIVTQKLGSSYVCGLICS